MSEERKVRDIVYERAEINIGLLHQQLKAALGDPFCGLSHDGKLLLRVHVYEEAPADINTLIEPIITAHDPAGETDSQKREKEETALLDTLKGKKPTEWKPDEKDRALEVLLRRLT